MLWLLASVPLAIFLFLAVGHIFSVIGSYLTRKHTSLIPFVGGVFGVIGFLIAPSQPLHYWWWIPLILDLGSVPLLLATAWFFTSRWLRSDRVPPH